MTTGFGFCPNCGAALTEAGQRFCAACGFTLPVAAAAAVVPPPYAAAPPPPYAAAPPPPPPPAWARPPVAPVGAAPAKTAVSPTMLLVGALVIAAIVAVGFFAMNGSKASSSASASHGGGLFGSALPTTSAVPATPTQGTGGGVVTLKPASFSCSDTSTQVTITVLLPASVSASDEVTGELDGVAVSTRVVGDTYEKQSDGRWLRSQTDSAASTCSGLEAGEHVYRVLDSQDNLLAQGSFTTTGETATPTPGGEGSLTVQPSSFSCSDTSTQVTITVLLPASVSGSAEITAILDGEKGGTDTVSGSGFTKQSDGRWVSTDSESASSVCSAYGAGNHTFSVVDAQGNILATGSFTANP